MSFPVTVRQVCCYSVAKCIQLSATLWSQAPLSCTISQSLLKFISIKLVMLSNHLILCFSLLLLPSILPSIRVFSNELAFCIRWPKYWSFSVTPSNEYSGILEDWLVGSLCSLRDSQESSLASQFESISSSVLSLPYGPNLTFMHDYWRNNSFDYTDLCWKSNVSAF